MKILWIVNTIFPAPSKTLGLPEPVFGGWMYGLAEQLSKSDGIELAVATTFWGSELEEMNLGGITYYLLPSKNKLQYDTDLEDHWKGVCHHFGPDVVHIHGTEYGHGLACMRKLPHLKYVISIQGLVSVIARYFYAGISFQEILKNITFRDIIRKDNLFQGKRKFEKRGVLERKYIENTKHVIGRTEWDYAHTKAINPGVNYHFCNESLRESFYTANKWSLENCERHTIFLSQAGYPIKGLHQVLHAVSALVDYYPNIKIRVGGNNVMGSKSFQDRMRLSGFGRFIKNLMRRHRLQDKVKFLGTLSENEMIAEYQRAHVFICPSSIENSPNSVSEAQLIGIPVIASYVGGTPDLVTDEISGLLYRFEEVEMLSYKIRRVFSEDLLAKRLTRGGIEIASRRHDATVNLASLVKIYAEVYNETSNPDV